MREAEVTAMALSDLIIAQTTVVTVCVALMIWLGLLGRPGRATLYWTYGYMLVLLGSYAAMTSAAMGTDVLLQPVVLGISCGLPALVWSGIRALQGKRAFVWTGIVQSIISVALLWLTTQTPYGLAVFRWLILASAVGAALGVVEVLRGAFQGSRFAVPLIAGSAILMLLGLVGVIGSGLQPEPGVALAYVRAVVLATICYVICTTVSLLFLANRRPGARDILEAMDDYMPVAMMRAVVRERLPRIAKREEQNWTFIDMRLDDVTDLREATGDAAFAAMVRRLEDIVVQVFPAEADLCRVTPGHITIFVSQSSAAVRELVRTVLNTVGAPQADSPTTLRVTASAGIVTLDMKAANSYESVAETAGRATEQSQLQGGDRWMRVHGRSTSV